LEPPTILPDSPVHRSDFFKKIVDNLQVGVIISDYQGRIIYINDTYARFLDIDPRAEVGKHATDVVANTRLHIVAKTGQMEINYPHQFKDHGFLVHRVPIKENDQVIAVVGVGALRQCQHRQPAQVPPVCARQLRGHSA
jgi:transcriptional regulator with PAS, ATPase and Fis domain